MTTSAKGYKDKKKAGSLELYSFFSIISLNTEQTSLKCDIESTFV